jgi:hypothetical protein
MAWTTSKIFRQWIADSLAPTASFVGKWNSTDVYNAALYNNTTTPDATVTAALSAYNAGTSQWVVANEVIDTLNSNWVAGGRQVAGTGSGGGYASSGSTITFDGNDTAGAGNVTITNAFGDLLYDNTLATPVSKQGAAFHYFGGAQSVTNGTFTIVWNVAGLMQVTF